MKNKFTLQKHESWDKEVEVQFNGDPVAVLDNDDVPRGNEKRMKMIVAALNKDPELIAYYSKL